MTTTDERVATPALGRTLRRIAPWAALAVAAVLVAVLLLLVALRPQSSTADLAADNPGPTGAQAVARVLAAHGVDVRITTTLDRTEGAVDDPADTTVLAYDPQELLSPAQHRRLAAAADDLVLVEPGFRTLGDLAPGVGIGGPIDTRAHPTLPADCALPAVRAAGTVAGGGTLYDAGGVAGATSCLRTADGAGLVRLRHDGRTITILGIGDVLRDDTIAQHGDAALALRLLGAHHRLVWYLPSFDDLADTSSTQTLADLTPPWVTPLVLLLGVAAAAAMLWRGRRLGPVVVESMPVVVRASETMEGRARLYERAGARAHALDQLRVGTTDRVARRLGMPRSATGAEVADAVAAALERPRAEVDGILRDRVPATDAELIALSDALLQLEGDLNERMAP